VALMREGRVLGRLISIVLLAVCVAGCNTIHGMGKDIEKGGEAVQDAAQGVKQKM
jgi:predicted small secreted protein